MSTFDELKQALTAAVAAVDAAEDQILSATLDVEYAASRVDAAATKLDDATAANSAAIVQLLAANAALQRYVLPTPEPPTPPSTIAGFNVGRMLHEQDTRYNVADQAASWEFQVIQGDVWKLPMVQQLRSLDPAATLLRPSTWTARRAGDTNGYTTLLPPGQIPDRWMLRNNKGAILQRSRDGDQLVDPGNVEYRNAAASNLIKIFTEQPYWSGVWIDEVIADWAWWNATNLSGGLIAVNGYTYSTLTQWQEAVAGLVETVSGKVKAAGKEVWANLSSKSAAATDEWSKRVARATTGTTQEFFVARGTEPTATIENGHYKAAVDWISYLNGIGRKYHMNAQTDSVGLADYAAGVFALHADPSKGFFSAGKDPYPVAGTMNTPVMQYLRRTGAPKGFASGGQRVFEKGTIMVNPSAQASNLLPATTAIWVTSY